MSIYYSKYFLNTYSVTPYFRSQVPENYQLNLTLQKCRAFRRLPPRLRDLSALAKQWAERNAPDLIAYVKDWYDEEGYELNPDTRKRLTDAETDALWADDPDLDEFKVKDIPLPKGGFADPDTWEEPPPEPEEEDPDADEGISEEQLLKDIKSHGREYVAKDYGISKERLSKVKSDGELARAILGT